MSLLKYSKKAFSFPQLWNFETRMASYISCDERVIKTDIILILFTCTINKSNVSRVLRVPMRPEGCLGKMFLMSRFYLCNICHHTNWSVWRTFDVIPHRNCVKCLISWINLWIHLCFLVLLTFSHEYLHHQVPLGVYQIKPIILNPIFIPNLSKPFTNQSMVSEQTQK